jgi:hypothetical protein
VFLIKMNIVKTNWSLAPLTQNTEYTSSLT